MAASISYYAFFSLFPLTLLVVSLFGIVLRDEELQVRVLDSIVDFLPIESASVENSIRNVAELGPTLTVFSFIATAWAAAAVSASVRSALNVVFGGNRRRPFLRAKLLDYALLPIIGLPLLGGVTISAIVQFARDEVLGWSPVLYELSGFAWGLVALVVPLMLSFTAFLLVYWLLPVRSLRFRYLWPGALFAAVAFELLKLGFTYYLANFGTFDVVYGSLASVVVLLFWIFLTANILILGAEIAAEIPGILHPDTDAEADRATEVPWTQALWRLLLGLVMVVEDQEPVPRRRRVSVDPPEGDDGYTPGDPPAPEPAAAREPDPTHPFRDGRG